MKHVMVSAVFLALAGCATPQQQCISSVTRDLQVVDSLIQKLQGNLARGYAYQTVTISTPRLEDCTRRPTEDNPNPRQRVCYDEDQRTVSQPVAVDLNAEAAKLASLQQKRAQLAAASGPAILACQQQYPQAVQ